MATRKRNGKQTKQGFVSSLAPTVTFEQALERAKAEGVGTFTRKAWHVMRSTARTARKRKHATHAVAPALRPGDGIKLLTQAINALGIKEVRALLDLVEAVRA